MKAALPFLLLALLMPALVKAQVVINEIHYKPLELEAFNADGTPFLDLTDDVHEFVELRNSSSGAVDLGGWKLTDAVSYTFPAGTSIPAGGFVVVAKNVTRLQTVYGLTGVLGPYSGKLSNSGDTVRVKDANGNTIDSVNYSASFPWAQSAHALGANGDFLGVSLTPYQYKGRSLERVSATASSNDPANWLASPLASGPSPGRANSVSRTDPKPVVVAFNVSQNTDEAPVIRAGNPVRVNATFSATTNLSAVELQWWVDNIDAFGETVTSIPMTDLGNGQYTLSTPIPGQVDRSIVRFRIRANRGDGVEVVSPRADDPQLVPVSATTKEAWHAYFVQPVRTSNGRVNYDVFVSQANITILTNNISQNPRRVQASPGYPRDDPFYGYYTANPGAFPEYNPAFYPAAGAPKWNGTTTGIFVKDGIVYDVQARFHGSRYNRSAGKNAWKFIFPSTKLLDGIKQRMLVTEKGSDNVLGYALFHAAELPAAYSQFVNFYKNTDSVITRCEISDNDEEMISRYQDEIQARYPQTPQNFNGLGVIYKAKGLDGDEGPYGWANGQKIPATGPFTELDRYIWSFPIQNSDWRGHTPFRNMLNALWAARGDASRITYSNNYSGDPTTYVSQDALRTYLDANWDKDKILSYIALRNWMSPWDDKFHNAHIYLQGNGKWTMVPWDFDGEMAGTDVNSAAPTNSILAGKKDDLNGSYSNNSRGPNWFKDSILRGYDDSTGTATNKDFRQKLFILNNTLLKPANVIALATSIGITVPDTNWLSSRFASVNSQLGLGTWYAPNAPVNATPAANASVLPGASLATSAYSHTNPTAVAQSQTRWEIRTSDGTYAAPVYSLTSTTNLTSLPIPFDLLSFGRTYAWRATFYDTDGHPSDPSAETSFTFGPAAGTVTLAAISSGSPWKYNQTGQFNYPSPAPAANDPTWWASTAYNDGITGWASGDPLFGVSTSTALPPNIRTTLTYGRTTYYFRRVFNFPGSPTSSTVRAYLWLDDGCVVYINGVEVPELRRSMLNGTPLYGTFATATVGTATQEGPISVPSKYFVQGANTVAVEVHQAAASSSDIVFALGLEADIPQAGGNVVLNEVMADNRTALSNGGSHPDYVEIYNSTATAVALDGWNLTDDILLPTKFTFPAGTTVAAGGYLVVFCDSDDSTPGLHTGFKISSAGETLTLIQGATVQDFITFGPQAPDLPIGRVGTGVGVWSLVAPSPGAANAAVTLGSSTTLKVNEWMANPSVGEDYFELYNPSVNPVALAGLYLSDTPGTPKITQIPDLSFIAGHGFTLFQADGSTAGANHCNFKLSASGENLLLTAANGITSIDSVGFGAQTLNVSSGRLPDGGVTIVAFPQSPTPGESNFLPAPVVINEALTNSTTPLEDAIEIYNPGSSAVNLGNWWLSDNHGVPQKFQLPAATTIAAGGYLVLYENQFNSGANPFSLNSAGDEIVLSAADGTGALTGYRAQVTFGAATDGISFGRILTGTPTGSAIPEFWPLIRPTFGQDGAADVVVFRTGAGLPNAAPKTGPIVINEVMYHPPDLAGADNARDEFIELHNITTAAQAIGGWKLTGDSTFTFPAGATIRPGDYALLVSFDPSADPSSLAAFRSTYGLTASTLLFGPYVSKLSNSTQTVELDYPGPAINGTIPYLMVDRIIYSDSAPWPPAADGNGFSLQRISRTAIGNDPANWVAATPSPGAVSTGESTILDNDGDGIPNAWEDAHGLDKFNAADAVMDSDGDGQTNLAEFLSGTDPHNAADFFKAEVVRPESGGGFSIRFTATANHTYSVLYKNSLNDALWQKLADLPAQASDHVVEQSDPNPGSQRFYEVITPQQP